MTGVRGKGRVAGAQRAALARALYPRALRPFLLSYTRTPLHPIPPSFPAGWLPLPFLNTRSVTVNHPAEGSAWEGSGPLKGFAKPAPQLRQGVLSPVVLASLLPGSGSCWAEKVPFSKGTWDWHPGEGAEAQRAPSVCREGMG